MRRSFISRIASLGIATLVGVTAPGLALLHGDAHDDVSELAVHGRTAGEQAAHSSRDEAGSAHVEKIAADHAHPEVAGALSVRMDARVFTLPPVAVEILSGIGFARTASLLVTASHSGSGPGRASTRQPRAPPLS